MTDTVTQMAAMSAALRMLLADHPLRKPDNLLIAASNEVTAAIINMMMSHASSGRSVFLALFEVDGGAALMSRVMIVDGSTTKGQINIGGGKFVKKGDSSFAILSINRNDPYEYAFDHGGHHLTRKAVVKSRDRALMELHGMQALITKAGTAACQAEARDASFGQW